MRWRSLSAALLAVTLPAPAFSFGVAWTCTAGESLICTPGQGCESREPIVGELTYEPIQERIAYCLQSKCYEGYVSLGREGQSDGQQRGVAIVEALPLPAHYTGHAFHVAVDEEARRFVLSGLSPLGQTVTWFDCE